MAAVKLLAIITTTHACLDAPQRPRRHHHALVTRRWVARRFPRHDPSRYFSILKAPVGTEYWLLTKNGSYPNAALKSTLNVFKGCDAKLRGCAPPHVAARGASAAALRYMSRSRRRVCMCDASAAAPMCVCRRLAHSSSAPE